MGQRKSPELLHSLGREKIIDQSQFFQKIQPIVEKFVNHHSKMTINIAGQSAVGKSTISEKLVNMFGQSASIVNIDNYLLGWDVGVLNHDSGIPGKPYFAGLNPQVYDLPRLQSDLKKLHEGQEVEMPWFNEITKRRGGVTRFSPAPILVIDGIYALDDEYREYADLSLLVEAPLHDRLIRKIFRNSVEHLEAVDAIIATYLTRDEPTYTYHVDRLYSAADWVIRNPIQPEKEFVFGESSYARPQNIKIVNAVPKSETGMLRETEQLAIIIAGREIFIQYLINGTILLSAPISEATLALMAQYYELQGGTR